MDLIFGLRSITGCSDIWIGDARKTAVEHDERVVTVVRLGCPEEGR